MTPGEALAIFQWFEYVRKNNPDMLTKDDYYVLRDCVLAHMTEPFRDLIMFGDENFK